jgi:hypothetical protein
MFSSVFNSPAIEIEKQPNQQFEAPLLMNKTSSSPVSLSIEDLKDSNKDKHNSRGARRTPESDLSVDVTSLQLPYFKFKSLALRQIVTTSNRSRVVPGDPEHHIEIFDHEPPP